MKVSELLRQARTAAGLTQAQLAHRTALTTTVISAYENARREPAATVFLDLMAAAGVRPGWTSGPDPTRSAERLVQVLELAEALPYRPRPLTRPAAPWTA